MNYKKTISAKSKKLLCFLYNNNTLPVFVTAFVCRVAGCLIQFQFNSPEFLRLAEVNACFALMELPLIVFYNRINKLASFTFFTVELVCFCVIEAIVAQMECGSLFCVIACVPATTLLTTKSKPSKRYYATMYVLFAAAFVILLWYKLRTLPPVRLYLPERRIFFISSKFFWVLMMISYLLYTSFLTNFSLDRMERKRQLRLKQIDYASKHDPLTGLMNRRRIHIIFNECAYLKNKNNTDYAICIFDIDNFKRINDTYGHPAGDYCLTNYAKSVWDKFKEPVRIGRWGGEEFVIIFPEVTDNTIFELESARKAIAENVLVFEGKEIKVTATYGISSSRKLSSPEEILSDADQALLEGKQHGKNRLVVSEIF